MGLKGLQIGSELLILSLNAENGWNKKTLEECATLIDKLTPDEVIKGLQAAVSLSSSGNKKNLGRPKSYRTAWIQLVNNLITLEEFQTILQVQLIHDEIHKDTYYRAIRKAKDYVTKKDKMKLISKLQTYEEIWIALQSNHINWEEFQSKLMKLRELGTVSEEKYQHALEEGKKFLRIRKLMIELENPK